MSYAPPNVNVGRRSVVKIGYVRTVIKHLDIGSKMDILLKGAVCMLFAALVLAWVGIFTKLIVIRPVQAMIKDYEALIRAHIDLLLMSLFCLALYAVRIPLAEAACWMIVIGGFSNPSLFLLRALDPESPNTWPRQIFRLASFATTSTGFGWAGCSIFQATY